MNEATKTKEHLEKAIVACASRAEKACNALEALQFSQAALNVTNALLGIKSIEK